MSFVLCVVSEIINYDKKDKTHSCHIERFSKQ